MLYREIFDIDPEYFPTVNEAIIQKRPDLWKKFYPHETFVTLLKNTVSVLNRKQKLGIWVEGAYGTGKSHAVLTLKHLLDASPEDTKEYFDRYNLDSDLYNKFQGAKNAGKILTVHRYGSSSIQGDNDLVIAIQESIQNAFVEAGMENKASSILKDGVIHWLEDEDNKMYFNSLVKKDYATLFGGDDADAIVNKLNTLKDEALIALMRKITRFAKDRNIFAFTLSVHDLCEWIKETIHANDLAAIVFIWDEFTEFFSNNLRSLTGFQEIAETSGVEPFYLMIVTHKSAGLFNDADKDKTKILDRFISPTSLISLPENIAFQLIGEAMQVSSDENVQSEWAELVGDLYDRTREPRKLVRSVGMITDEEMKRILPIHPYAALILKQISAAFDSNQRSMFDFLKNDRGDSSVKGFQWFIDNYGPLDENPLLTVDMLWDFFYTKGHDNLAQDVRAVLDCYSRARLTREDEQKVYKTILLLQAISQKVGNAVELFIPNERNLKYAFTGTELENAANRIASKLANDKVIYIKKLSNNETVYSTLTAALDTSAMDQELQTVRARATSALVTEGILVDAISLSAPLKQRYKVDVAAVNDFDTVVRRVSMQNTEGDNKIPAIVTFAKDDSESIIIGKKISAVLSENEDMADIVFIDASLTPFGSDGFEQYVQNAAAAAYHSGKDNGQARVFGDEAKKDLKKWRDRIEKGEFMVYTRDDKIGKRAVDMDDLNDRLRYIDLKKYPLCLECEYTVTDPMFNSNSLKLGVECGATEKTTGPFKSASISMKLEEALKGAWQTPDYWTKAPQLLISKIKMAVKKTIDEAFETDGRISIRAIYDSLKAEPFGFMPCNLSAFIMGFVLKEYTDGSYTWSDNLTNEPLTVDKLKEMVGDVISLDITANNRYKEKYLGCISPSEKAFNEATSKIFAIPANQCTTIEQTRERIRAKMKELAFPIWVLKDVIKDSECTSDCEDIKKLIDLFCGIANNNNIAGKSSDNDIAIKIGEMVMESPELATDLQKYVTTEKCTEGMKVYLDRYEQGLLPQLAEEIGDNGQYINELKRKFSSDATWVWNVETTNKKIDDLAVDYQIIAESNKINSATNNFNDCMEEWCEKCGRIKISYQAAKSHFGGLAPLMDALYKLKQMGDIVESQRRTFLNLLKGSGDDFRRFYTNQIEMFKLICSFDLEDLSEEEIRDFFTGSISTGMFVKEKSEFMNIVSDKAAEFRSNLGYKKLKAFWKEKTGTDSPGAWSETNKMPVLAMVPDGVFSEVKEAFDVINRTRPDAASVVKAQKVVEAITFWDDLASVQKRDSAFVAKIIKTYSVLLTDIDEVKNYLCGHITAAPYEWLGLPAVETKVALLADSKYSRFGCDKAIEKIDGMDEREVKRYLKQMIKDSMTVGIEILRNN